MVKVPNQSSSVRSKRQSPSRAFTAPTCARVAIAAYRMRQAITERLRCIADEHGHDLGPWRPDPHRDGRQLATCLRCGAGVTYYADAQQASVSDALTEHCPRGAGR